MGETKYFYRPGAKNPECVQDYPAVIRVGGGETRIFNLRTQEWFTVTDEPTSPMQLGTVIEIVKYAYLEQTGGLTGPPGFFRRIFRRARKPEVGIPLRPPERSAVCADVEEHLSHDRIHKPESKLVQGLKWLLLLKWARPRMRVWEDECPKTKKTPLSTKS